MSAAHDTPGVADERAAHGDAVVAALTDRTPGVANALVVGPGGAALARSPGLDPASAEQLAMVVSELSGLARGAARCLDAGAVRQAIVELEHGFLFVQQMAGGSSLAALVESTADLGEVGYAMALVADTPAP